MVVSKFSELNNTSFIHLHYTLHRCAVLWKCCTRCVSACLTCRNRGSTWLGLGIHDTNGEMWRVTSEWGQLATTQGSILLTTGLCISNKGQRLQLQPSDKVINTSRIFGSFVFCVVVVVVVEVQCGWPTENTTSDTSFDTFTVNIGVTDIGTVASTIGTTVYDTITLRAS